MTRPALPPSARILVSEDDPIQAAVIAAILQEEGYQVETRETLRDTRAAVRARVPDLLLLDRMLPDGDGCLLCQELKADTATQGLPIIMLTARDRVEERVEGLLRGADDYILKPFHPKELLARVHGALRTLSLQRELRQKAEELEQQHQMLVATQEQLVRSQRLAAIGEIGLAIRHEINNPLGSILGFVDLLIAQGEAFSENVRRKLDAIRRATIRIRDVVRRLEDIQDDRTVEYVQGIQMTDLGVQSPGPLGHVQAVPRPAAEGQQHAPGVGEPDPA
jgi:DNA-binding response OmpR family regulator